VRPHIPVLVVDDDAVVRAWLRLCIKGSEFYLAGEASTVDEAKSLAGRRAPRLLLVDYRLGAQTGVDLIRELRREGFTAPALVMTARAEPGLNEAAAAAGAQGTVLKRDRPDDLLATLRAVLEGRGSFDPEHPHVPRETGQLSKREREVLSLVAQGSTNAEVAARLGIGEETVKTLLGRVYAKLGVRRRAEAVATAHQRGLL
jgi:DNA-binding NarL/FixJ family response regulator